MADVVVVNSSEESDDDTNNLSSEECEKRCQEFANVTGTDTALAMFYLQDRDWNLERSLNDYFQSQAEESGSQSSSPPISSSSLQAEPSNNRTSSGRKPSEPVDYLTTAPPVLQPRKDGSVRILSWNIDGLDPDNLQSRTEGVCSVLTQENPEVIFLQEVVKRSLSILDAKLSQRYHLYCGCEHLSLVPVGGYFTAVMVRKDCVDMESVRVADFPTTTMERNLLIVQCRIRSQPVTLMTSHLESTAEYHEERKRQLKIAFDLMKKQEPDRTVVFGGDLNLRDKELNEISAKPQGVYDFWECTGKRPEAKFTWDLTRNDNKQLHTKFQPKSRFDRMYILHPKDKVRMKPVYFELVGIQRLASCRRFPSDHWGILGHLKDVC